MVRYARLSPLELLIWITGVVLAFFRGLEVSIYATIALSAVLLLVRMSRTRGRFMGCVKVQDIRPAEDAGCGNCRGYDSAEEDLRMVDCCLSSGPQQVYVPLDRRDGSNPLVEVNEVHPGVIVYRFPEGLNYTNCAHHIEDLEAFVIRNTSKTTEEADRHPSVSYNPDISRFSIMILTPTFPGPSLVRPPTTRLPRKRRRPPAPPRRRPRFLLREQPRHNSHPIPLPPPHNPLRPRRARRRRVAFLLRPEPLDAAHPRHRGLRVPLRRRHAGLQGRVPPRALAAAAELSVRREREAAD